MVEELKNKNKKLQNENNELNILVIKLQKEINNINTKLAESKK